MADPVKKPLTWSKSYPSYAERYEMYRVFQELLKELIIMKPLDPLAYIRDELPKIANQLYAPRAFIIGPNVTTQGIGRQIAQNTGTKYLTLADIVETSPIAVRGVLAAYVQNDVQEEGFDDNLRKLLVRTIMQRVRCHDCQKNGYILYGFPQNKPQALCAQQTGLLPRQVFILMPEQITSKSRNSDSNIMRSSSTGATQMTNSLVTISGGTLSPAPAKGASQTAPGVPPPQAGGLLIEEANGTLTKVSSHVSIPESDYPKIKEIADCYDYEICKVIPYEKWSTTKKTDIHDEFLASIVSVKPCGTPWIPRILVIGPPSSGKSIMAQQLSEKYGFVNVDFIDCVRGMAQLQDDIGRACKKYLRDLNPMTDSVTRNILQKRLLRTDCEKKGWILHGFPDTIRQLTILDILEISPNRVFYLSCPEDVCWSRLQQKRQQVLERKMPGAENKGTPWVDEMNFEEFPYGKTIFRIRTDNFYDNLDAISAHFGKNIIYVDATQKMSTIYQFMDAGVLRPPVIRFQDV